MSHTTTRRVLAAALCAAAVAVPAVQADAASSTTTGTTTQRAGTGALTGKSLVARTVLTSTSGKRLTMTISAVKGSVSIGLGSGREQHTWTFRSRATDLAISGTGAGTLKLSSAQTGSRGRLDLTFKPSGAYRQRSCGGQLASKSRPMAVSGIAYLKTGTAAWGNVGKAARSISLAGANRVTWTYDTPCSTPPAPCVDALTWSSYRFTSTVTQGVSGSRTGSSSTVMGYRSTTLPTPAGAIRLDSVLVTGAPAPSFSGTTDGAQVVATSGGGSLTVAGENGWESDAACGSGTSAGTVHTTQWSGTATNGSPAFRIPAQVFGAFTVRDGEMASITRQVH